MRLKNEIFAHVLDWLIQEKKVEDQKDLAVKTGISQNTVSRIMTGKVEPSDDTLRKLNSAFGNIFNMQYLRGESVVMLNEDAAYYKTQSVEHPLTNLKTEEPSNAIDQSSLVNAALAAKDQVIAQMELRLSEKDEIIQTQRLLIQNLQQQLAELRATSTNYDKHPFPMGVADKPDMKPERV